MIEIDGSLGEGGGQVLRSSLTLSIMTSQEFRIDNIRVGRKNPGLRPQHLASIEAAAKVCNGEVDGAGLGSSEITFSPGELRAGK